MIEELFESPERFEFYQAVRLLERWLGSERRSAPSRETVQDGQRLEVHFDSLRFRGSPALTFPTSEIARIAKVENPPTDTFRRIEKLAGRIEMTVRFLGLVGFSGTLPIAYAALAATDIGSRRDGFNDFLDIFHDRLVRLFYDAWQKHHLPAAYERAAVAGQSDQTTRLLRALVGQRVDRGGAEGLLSPDLSLYYAGDYARQARSPVSLERILADSLNLSVTVEEFVGVWLPIPPEEQSRLSGDGYSSGAGVVLSGDLLLGSDVWDVESTIRLTIGPLQYPQYEDLLPGSLGLARLGALVTDFVPGHLRAVVKLILADDQVPMAVLRSRPESVRLSLNVWLRASDSDEGRSGVDVPSAEFMLG